MAGSYLEYPIRGRKFSYSLEVREHLYAHATPYQRIDVYDTVCFGRVLTLDGHVQLSSLDEFAYHEALVHIPLLSVPEPKRALVVGGGDGGVLRELCRWKSFETIDMVEIDKEVIDASKRWLPELSEGAFDDPRVNVRIGDAFEFVAKVSEDYDFIVMDITDVYEEEAEALSENLVTAKFLADVRNALSPKGIAVSQADNLLFCPYSLKGLLGAISDVFAKSGSYWALIPSFGGFSGYCWASKEAEILPEWPGSRDLRLRYLNELSYRMAFSPLPFSKVAEHLMESEASIFKG
jgi:spermidine synthase